jgi:hypothetical protein
MATTQVTVQENVTSITIDAATSITVNEDVTTLEISAGAAGASVASSIGVTPYGTISSTNVQSALQELADDFFRQDGEPESAEEGDLWYDTDDDALKAYIEIGGSPTWTTLLQAGAENQMLLLDGGNF